MHQTQGCKKEHNILAAVLSSSSRTTFAATDKEAEDEFEAKVSQHFVT